MTMIFLEIAFFRNGLQWLLGYMKFIEGASVSGVVYVLRECSFTWIMVQHATLGKLIERNGLHQVWQLHPSHRPEPKLL